MRVLLDQQICNRKTREKYAYSFPLCSSPLFSVSPSLSPSLSTVLLSSSTSSLPLTMVLCYCVSFSLELWLWDGFEVRTFLDTETSIMSKISQDVPWSIHAWLFIPLHFFIIVFFILKTFFAACCCSKPGRCFFIAPYPECAFPHLVDNIFVRRGCRRLLTSFPSTDESVAK